MFLVLGFAACLPLLEGIAFKTDPVKELQLVVEGCDDKEATLFARGVEAVQLNDPAVHGVISGIHLAHVYSLACRRAPNALMSALVLACHDDRSAPATKRQLGAPKNADALRVARPQN